MKNRSTLKLFDSPSPEIELEYNEMVTHLGDYFSSLGVVNESNQQFSLFKDISEVNKRYEDPVLIGQGGMKSIYRVKDRMTDREVALAIVRNLRGKNLIEQFIKEARLTANLEHPNIMPIYDIGIDEIGEPFFTMKLIRGESLRNIIKNLREGNSEYRKRYSLESLLEIFMKVCDAVGYAHTNAVLHLDLKPDNIQIGSFGEVLVSDWGLSRYRQSPVDVDNSLEEGDRSEVQTYLGSDIHGTPGYMSPEQIMKTRDELTCASDIYSLGAILYEMITFSLPVTGETPKEMMDNTVNGVNFSKNKTDIPSSLKAVCRRAMSLQPENRYLTASELKKDILAFRHGFPTFAENSGFLTSLLMLIKRHKTISAISMTSVIILVSVCSIFIYTVKKSNEEADTEKKLRKQIEREVAAPARHKDAIQSYKMLNFKEAYKSLKEALQFDPSNESLHTMQGMVLLGNHDFSNAAEQLKKVENEQLSELVKCCEKLKSYSGSKEKLPWADFSDLIKLLQKTNNNPLVCQLLINEVKKGYSLKDKIRLAYKTLKIQNKLKGILKMDCLITKTKFLKIRIVNQPVDNISALVMLPIIDLDLSNTKVHDLLPLNKLPIKKLNLTNTLVNELSSISGSPVNELNIAYTKVVSVKNIDLPELKTINIKGVELDDTKIFQEIPGIKVIN